MVTFTEADDRRQSYSRPGRASMPASKSYSNVSSTSNNNNNNNNNNTGITTLDNGTISIPEVNTFSTKPDNVNNVYGDDINLTNMSDETWELAIQAAASNPGYAKSFEGQQLIKAGITPESNEWVAHFGLPSIISMTGSKQPATTSNGDFIMTGQGQHLFDNYNNPTGSYDEKVQEYYDTRTNNEAQQQGNQNQPGYGYDYGPGSSSGYGGGINPSLFARGRGRGNQLNTAMMDPRMGGVDASQTASNMLTQLGQGSKAFAMDPNTAGILTMLQG